MSRESPKYRDNFTLDPAEREMLRILAEHDAPAGKKPNKSATVGKLIREETERRRTSHARKG